MTDEIIRETMEYDVVIVGGGLRAFRQRSG